MEILKKVRELKSLTDVLDIDADDDDNDDDNDDDDDDGDGDDDGVSKRCSHQNIPLQRRMHFGGKYQVTVKNFKRKIKNISPWKN